MATISVSHSDKYVLYYGETNIYIAHINLSILPRYLGSAHVLTEVGVTPSQQIYSTLLAALDFLLLVAMDLQRSRVASNVQLC